MNNVFDIKRFWNYFLYDLRRAKNNYGLSLLILGLIPILLYIITQFISLISGNGISDLVDEMKFVSIFSVWIIAIFSAGAKLYGFVTEKRAGSDYLMLPASTLEKWLSLALMVCIVVPAVLCALLFVSDGLMGLLFPNSYGDRIFSQVLDNRLFDSLGEEGIQFNLPAILFLGWCENILVFTLGALCFKKAKAAKTLLCIMGVSMVLSTLMALFFGTTHIGTEQLEAFFDTPERVVRFLNWTINILYTVIIGGLLGGIYYRLRTLKH